MNNETSDATVTALYRDLGKALKLDWRNGKRAAERKFVSDTLHGIGVVNYFNPVHTSQVQVIGPTELKFLSALDPSSYRSAIGQLLGPQTIVIVFTDDLAPPEQITQLADERNIGLFVSPLSGEQVVNELMSYLTRTLAEKISLHGVFMEVLSVGVLLTGASGVGKSELALELLTHGHRLIADDAPLFARIAPDIIIGTAPFVIQDFLEVRGLGVLNVREMYGDSAIKRSKYLKLIIDLQPLSEAVSSHKRLVGLGTTREILGLDIPVFTLPVAPGRNLAVLVEAAVRNHTLISNRDYRADVDITHRQNQIIHRDKSD